MYSGCVVIRYHRVLKDNSVHLSPQIKMLLCPCVIMNAVGVSPAAVMSKVSYGENGLGELDVEILNEEAYFSEVKLTLPVMTE